MSERWKNQMFGGATSRMVPQKVHNLPADFLHFLPSRHRALSLCFFVAPHFFCFFNLWSVVSWATALRRHLVDVHRRTVLTAVRLLVAPNEGYDRLRKRAGHRHADRLQPVGCTKLDRKNVRVGIGVCCNVSVAATNHGLSYNVGTHGVM